jgi:hypothetical protein
MISKSILGAVIGPLLGLALVSCEDDHYYLASGEYVVSSDCPGAPAPATLKLESKVAEQRADGGEPTATTYHMEGVSKYGLPSDDFAGTKNWTAVTAENDARVCKGRALADGEMNSIMFMCQDKASGAECMVFLDGHSSL